MEVDYADFQYNNQQKMDAGLLVRFFTKPVQDEVQTREQGRPIFCDVEYVDVQVPGDRLGGVCRPASSSDKQRWQGHYEAFKKRTSNDEVLTGTPLAQWPAVTRSQVEELAFFHVKTVEQLANLADSNAHNFMGIHAMRRKAVEWLEISKEQNAAQHLKDELAKRDMEIEELKAAVAGLLDAKVPRGTSPVVAKKAFGRPRGSKLNPLTGKYELPDRPAASNGAAAEILPTTSED